MIPIVISGFLYLFVFLTLISNLQLLKYETGVRLLKFLRLKKLSNIENKSPKNKNSLELSDLFNIYIYNKDESKNKNSESTNRNNGELSY